MLNKTPMTAEKVKQYSGIYKTEGEAASGLKKGYIIERASGEGDYALYNILYSSILANSNYTQYSMVTCSLDSKARQDIPAIKDSYVIKDNKCIFNWHKYLSR